jgi:hypothetical protein
LGFCALGSCAFGPMLGGCDCAGVPGLGLPISKGASGCSVGPEPGSTVGFCALKLTALTTANVKTAKPESHELFIEPREANLLSMEEFSAVCVARTMPKTLNRWHL